MPNLEFFKKFQKWALLSLFLQKDDLQLFLRSMELGYLDVILSQYESDLNRQISQSARREGENHKMFEFMEFSLLSKYFVYESYEFVRVLDKREEPSSKIKEFLSQKKRNFERVRVPLAKFEKATKFKETDFERPIQTFSECGFTWQISDDLIVTRKQLADQLVEILSEMNDHYLNLNQKKQNP